LAFLNGQLCPGIDAVMDMVGFDDAVAGVDLVITGEGRLDGQTMRGKLVHGVCRRAARYGVPVIALCGAVAATAEQIRAVGLLAAFSISPKPQPLEQALEDTARNLHHSASQVAALWGLSQV
jgi:glycerate kinase